MLRIRPILPTLQPCRPCLLYNIPIDYAKQSKDQCKEFAYRALQMSPRTNADSDSIRQIAAEFCHICRKRLPTPTPTPSSCVNDCVNTMNQYERGSKTGLYLVCQKAAQAGDCRKVIRKAAQSKSVTGISRKTLANTVCDAFDACNASGPRPILYRELEADTEEPIIV